jgi:hypothetical protein
MPVPKSPDPAGKRTQTERDRDAAVKRLGKAAEITPDDVARHPGEPDYDRDAK